MKSFRSLKMVRINERGIRRKTADQLACEEPLEIRVRGQAVSVTMRTPGHDEELAVGFLLSEGIFKHWGDVMKVASCQLSGDGRKNVINVFLSPSVKVDMKRLTRHVFASSSCGLCGKTSIDAVHQHFDPLESRLKVKTSLLARLPDQLKSAQKNFSRTGGVHAAAIFDSRGKLVVLREDVGRHNAVDKVLGYGFLHRALPFDRHILLVSGRASFEIIQKALAGRIAMVAAISAPSHLAAQFAWESGQTLIGFLRGKSMNVYSHPKRVI